MTSGAAVNVQRPHRLRADREPERFKARAAGGRLEIEHLEDRARWLIRSSDGVYSYSASMAIADEAWDLPSSVVDDGLAPVLLQRRSPQLWVVSTANSKATGLMLGLRAQALAELSAPGSTLWLEWSMAPDADVGDPAVWAAACPRWTDDIAERYEELHDSALARRPSDPVASDPVEGFATQYLNKWPSSFEPIATGEPLVDARVWASCEEDYVSTDQPVVLSLEEHWDLGCALALVAEVDGRYFVQAMPYQTRADLFYAAGILLQQHPSSTVVVGPTLRADRGAVELYATPVAAADLSPAIATFRELVADGRLCHIQAEALTEQLDGVRIVASPSGLPMLHVARGWRVDMLRAALHGVYTAVKEPPTQPRVW